MTRSQLLDKIEKEISSQNYASLPFSVSREELEKAASNFLEFLDLPDETKTAFFRKVVPTDTGSTVGYVKRNQANRDADTKEYVHYNEYFDEYFSELLNTDPTIENFVNSARHIYNEAKKLFTSITDTFETQIPGFTDKFFSKDMLPRFYLRFLKYGTQGKNGIIAQGHYDRGALTLALAESQPGLRIGTQKSLTEIVHEEKQAILFPGKAIENILPHMQPAWHDVIQKNDKEYRPGVTRWAIVFFADAIDQPEYTVADTRPKNYLASNTQKQAGTQANP